MQHVGPRSLTRVRTQAPCTDILESEPMAHQGGPLPWLLNIRDAHLKLREAAFHLSDKQKV